jgi:hypothetical protein
MSAPKRWLDEAGSATRPERDLLRSGLSRELDPPPEAKAEVWASLLTQLPPPGGGAPSGGSPPGAGTGVTGAVGGGILKSALIGAASAVVLVVGYEVVTPSSSAPEPRPPPAIIATRAPSPGAATSGVADLPNPPAPTATEAPIAPASSKPAEPKAADNSAASERESRLREESQGISEARDALRSGGGAAALTQLEGLGQKFPTGVLVQEREALTIEALHKSGRRAEAAARADAFLNAYPTSPHAPRIQAFTQ